MNLGNHVGDQPQHVEANRVVLERAIACHPVFLKQVHGVAVEHLSLSTPDGVLADACVSTQRGVACTIVVADCLPVLLTNADGTVVAAAHAGWRGLAGVDANGQRGKKGVLEAVFSAFQALNKPLDQSPYARAAPEVIAWLGPCIGPKAFEVGAEVKVAVEATQGEASRFFVPAGSGKYLADLAGLARHRLQAMGVAQVYGNDGSAGWCTFNDPKNYFSHRRDAGASGNGCGTTGRMAACIWLDTNKGNCANGLRGVNLV